MDNEGSQALEEKSKRQSQSDAGVVGAEHITEQKSKRQSQSDAGVVGAEHIADQKSKRQSQSDANVVGAEHITDQKGKTQSQSDAGVVGAEHKSPMSAVKGYMASRFKPNDKGLNNSNLNRMRQARNTTNGNNNLAEKKNEGETGNDATENSADGAAQEAVNDIKAAAETAASAAKAYADIKKGNVKGAIKNAKNAKKGAKDLAKKAGKKIILIILAALLPLLFLIIIIVVLLLPFIAGFSLLADFIGDLFDSTESEYFGVPAVSESTAVQASIAVVSTVPGYDTYSPARKAFISSAAVGIGSPYTPNGEPTSNNYNGLSNGVDGFGFYQWIIWNTSLFNVGHLTPKAVADSTYFIKLDEAEILPGDIGVNDNDVGVYMGDNQWIHYDSTSNTFIQSSFEGYTSFYKYYNLEKTDTSTETTTSTAE